MSYTRTITVWKDAFCHKPISAILTDDDKQRIQAYLSGGLSRKGLNAERMKGTRVPVMTIRTNQKRRIFFIPRGDSICIIGVMEDHNHDTAHSLQPGVAERIYGKPWASLENERLDFEKIEFDDEEASAVDGSDFIIKDAISYNQHFISFDDPQTEAKSLAMPGLVIGDPGSGKTAIIFADLAELIASPEAEASEGCFVYYTASPDLARRMYEKFLLDNPAIAELPAAARVRFMNESDLYRAYAPENDRELMLVGFNHFKEFLQEQVSNYRKSLKKIQASLFAPKLTQQAYEMMYHECQIIASDKQEYMNKGNDACNYPQGKMRAWLLQQYDHYLERLAKSKKCDTSLVAWSPSVETPFYRTYFDEVQVASRLDMMRLKAMTQGGQVCYFGDTNQGNFKRLSDIPFLKSLAPNFITLAGSYRSPTHLIPLLNTVLGLKQHVNGGVNDKSQSPSVSANGSERGQQGNLSWVDTASMQGLIDELREKNTVFVVITPAWLKQKAIAVFGEDIPVYSPDEARGLEFETVLTYRMTETEPAKSGHQVMKPDEAQIEALLPEASETLVNKANLPKAGKGNRAFEAYFNQLFICFTRPEVHCFVIEDEEKGKLLPKLHGHLKKAMSATTQVVLESSLKDWELLAERNIATGNYEQALAAYKHLGKSEAELKQAMADYQATQAARIERVKQAAASAQVETQEPTLRVRHHTPKTQKPVPELKRKKRKKKSTTIKKLETPPTMNLSLAFEEDGLIPVVELKMGGGGTALDKSSSSGALRKNADGTYTVLNEDGYSDALNLLEGNEVQEVDGALASAESIDDSEDSKSTAIMWSLSLEGLEESEATSFLDDLLNECAKRPNFLLEKGISQNPLLVEVIEKETLLKSLLRLITKVEHQKLIFTQFYSLKWLDQVQDEVNGMTILHWMFETQYRRILLLSLLNLYQKNLTCLLHAYDLISKLDERLTESYTSQFKFENNNKEFMLFSLLAETNIDLLIRLYLNDNRLVRYILLGFVDYDLRTSSTNSTFVRLLRTGSESTISKIESIFLMHDAAMFSYEEHLEHIADQLTKNLSSADADPFLQNWNLIAILVSSTHGTVFLGTLIQNYPDLIYLLGKTWMNSPPLMDDQGNRLHNGAGVIIDLLFKQKVGHSLVTYIKSNYQKLYKTTILNFVGRAPVLDKFRKQLPATNSMLSDAKEELRVSVATALAKGAAAKKTIEETTRRLQNGTAQEFLELIECEDRSFPLFQSEVEPGVTLIAKVLEQESTRNALIAAICLSSARRDDIILINELFVSAGLSFMVVRGDEKVPLLLDLAMSEQGQILLSKIVNLLDKLHGESWEEHIQRGFTRDHFTAEYFNETLDAKVPMLLTLVRNTPLLLDHYIDLLTELDIDSFVRTSIISGSYSISALGYLLSYPSQDTRGERVKAMIKRFMLAREGKLIKQLIEWPGFYGREVDGQDTRVQCREEDGSFITPLMFDLFLMDSTLRPILIQHMSSDMLNLTFEELIGPSAILKGAWNRLGILAINPDYHAKLAAIILRELDRNDSNELTERLASIFTQSHFTINTAEKRAWNFLVSFTRSNIGVLSLIRIFKARPTLLSSIPVEAWMAPKTSSTGVAIKSNFETKHAAMLNIMNVSNYFITLKQLAVVYKVKGLIDYMDMVHQQGYRNDPEPAPLTRVKAGLFKSPPPVTKNVEPSLKKQAGKKR